MAIAAAGPSRRHHKKSRKGCKTCKKRHIRCDETYPQCHNCTKHQVKCDYQECRGTEALTSAGPLPFLPWSSEIEAILKEWEQTGEASMNDVCIDLHAQGHEYSKTDLHLLHYALFSNLNNNEFTVWTGKTPKLFATAKSQPFLVHAILAFNALSFAWYHRSSEAKSLAYQHGGLALEGLQRAIGTFSRKNADAILAASMLLSWQANDWRSWKSLIAGIRTVVEAMQPWKHDSALCDIILEQELSTPSTYPSVPRPPPSEQDRRRYITVLQQAQNSLETLTPYLVGRGKEASYVEQLTDYLHRLLRAGPVHSAEEQFNHLYALRTWLFWIPSEILRSESRDYLSLIVLAYFYATALHLDPFFPDVAPSFCSHMVLRPLDEIFTAFHALEWETEQSSASVQQLVDLLGYAKQVTAAYQSRTLRTSVTTVRRPHPDLKIIHSELAYSRDLFGATNRPSPAFFPAPLRHESCGVSSSRSSPFVEVPEWVVDETRSSPMQSPYETQKSGRERKSLDAFDVVPADYAEPAAPGHLWMC